MDDREGYCPVFHRAVELIGRRWNGPILRVLLDGAKRFGEIRSRVPGLTDRLLAQRLRELENEGVVDRACATASTVPHYSLTAKGQALAPVIESIAGWAAVWGDAPVRKGPRPLADGRRRSRLLSADTGGRDPSSGGPCPPGD